MAEITISVSELENIQLQLAAKQLNLTLSDYIREQCFPATALLTSDSPLESQYYYGIYMTGRESTEYLIARLRANQTKKHEHI